MSATAPAARPARSGSSASGLVPPEGGVPGGAGWRRRPGRRCCGFVVSGSGRLEGPRQRCM